MDGYSLGEGWANAGNRQLALLLFALSLKGGFSQTALAVQLMQELSDEKSFLSLLEDQRKRLSRYEWHVARREFEAADTLGVSVVTFLCPNYPPALVAIPDPPLVIFYRGRLDLATSVAVVGARRASEQGLATSFAVARLLRERGVSVISGLALGVDAAAHRGAIAAGRVNQRSSTVAVLGSGVGEIQPRQHQQLAEDILARDGAILSEFGVTIGAQRHHFPRRNRIIAGLSQKVIVIEAAAKSGSLITARLALEQGREVAAVPGPPLSEGYLGSNQLLRDGAELILSPADALEGLALTEELAEPMESFPEMHLKRIHTRLATLGLEPAAYDIGQKIISLLNTHGPMDADQLSQITGYPNEQLSVLLSLLELESLLTLHFGSYQLGEVIDSG